MKKIILIGLAIVLIVVLARLVFYSGMLREVSNEFLGQELASWEAPAGPEDLDLDYKRNHLLISSADRRNAGSSSDGIYMVDLSMDGQVIKKIKDDYPGQLYPHGIFVQELDSTTYVWVVNHQETQDYIEKFTYNGKVLTHLASYTDPLIQGANDVCALKEDLFYVTRDHGFAKGWKQKIEDYLILPIAKIIVYNEGRFYKVADGLQYPNGINVSLDQKQLYVAETTGRNVRVYNILDDYSLTQTRKISMKTGVDNIDIDEKGRLWIGCHPKLLAFVAHSRDPANLSPSEIIMIDPNQEYSIKEIFLNEGEGFSGCSSALYYNKTIYAGVVFDPVIWRGIIDI
jgi:arylesterase/paraoxonase